MYSNIYFIGIGGIGMSAIARYYKFKGLNVSGYDRTETELTRKLSAEGIGVHYTDSPELIPEDIKDTLLEAYMVLTTCEDINVISKCSEPYHYLARLLDHVE